MRILEGFINFIEDLIARKINFLESMWMLIEKIKVWGLNLNFEKFNC
jgi:hypothetical protein